MEYTEYRSIKKPSETLIKIKGSKFYASLLPFQRANDLKETLVAFKKKYPAAGHHCFAYRLSPNSSEERSSDDGEPSGTAGKPILGQLYANHLHYTLCVVSRVFGGAKLGTGGLRSAYKEAAVSVIDISQIITQEITFIANIIAPLEKAFIIHEMSTKWSGRVLQEEYENHQITLALQLPIKEKKSLDNWLESPDNQTFKLAKTTLSQN